MAQRRRGATEGQAKLERITLMIPAELKAQLDSEVEDGVRTFSDVARERLRQSPKVHHLSDEGVSPWARAVGRAVTLLADDIFAVGRPSQDALGMVRAGSQTLLSALGAEEPSDEDREMAELIAQLLAMKVERAKPSEGPSPNALADMLDGTFTHRRKQTELLQIQHELLDTERSDGEEG